ncbi:hypothetical protein PLICRDRAFT_176720 [Plicaturopsis crispa FD-325 SS-3]|nr:hypothetical protein PLICRDRAFT_176720 [Plicaturopsis crispa FD-325 SS-3]
MSSSSFVDPSSLSLPSPSTHASPSPSPKSEHSDSNVAGPSRKRARTESTTAQDERKEARAHRNRIAAQNSRDRRKAQFTYLERRVAELEDENRRLRAGGSSQAAADEKEKARDRENEELKERIKTLEKGWDAVVKALAAQGLPTGILPTPPPSSSETTPAPTADSPSPTDTTAFPVLVSPTTMYPLSPAASHNSSIFDDIEFESTRHLARVATTEAPPASVSLQRVDPQQHLFREILVTPTSTVFETTAPAGVSGDGAEWESDEAEMQRLLDMLPDVQSRLSAEEEASFVDFPSALDLEVGGCWDSEPHQQQHMGSGGIGVF